MLGVKSASKLQVSSPLKEDPKAWVYQIKPNLNLIWNSYVKNKEHASLVFFPLIEENTFQDFRKHVNYSSVYLVVRYYMLCTNFKMEFVVLKLAMPVVWLRGWSRVDPRLSGAEAWCPPSDLQMTDCFIPCVVTVSLLLKRMWFFFIYCVDCLLYTSRCV